MKQFYLWLTALALLPAGLAAQSFTNMSNLLDDSYNSGGCVGVTDMNNDGSDDIILLDNSNHLKVLYNLPGGFVEDDYGVLSSAEQWGFTVGDLDNDGHNDVISGGNFDGVHLTMIDGIGMSQSDDLNNGMLFMQGCNMADIDNDGALDYFACHDVGLSRIWHNDGNGGMSFNELIDLTDYDPGTFTDTDHSGNYGSVWTDFDDDGDIDLYIAKCRQGVSDPNDPRRINQLWINNGDGTWTEDALSRGLVIYEQSWTADFADYDNDGDFDCLITNHSTNIVLLENDGNGFFTDVSEAAGLTGYEGFFLQAKMVDFDNDGFNDIIWSGGTHRYLHNDGDGTFTEVANTFPYTDTMHSFGIGDLNMDGFLDVYASYGNIYVGSDNGNPDILWMNDGNDNNWVTFDLLGTESNLNAVGAKVKIYGDWGTQVREVRAGESYGIVNTFHLHFGIGQSETIDMVEIIWPSGIVTEIENPDINTVHQIVEGECQLEGLAIAADGPTQICPGESVTLSTDTDLIGYEWSTGETGPSITVSESGFYYAIGTDGNCNGLTNTIVVEVIQPVLPTITVNGDLEFCEGGSVELISSNAEGYTWSNGEESQAISVSESGTYDVAVPSQCAGDLSSESVEVIVYDAPGTPTADDVSIDVPGTATIEGTGNLLHWYESEMATDPLFIGNTFETPFQETTTSYWVEDVIQYGGVQGVGGEETIDEANGQYHFNSDFWLVFDANEDIIIDSVKVFSGAGGERTIGVVDANNSVIAQTTVFIFEGESYVPLDLFVPAGTDYGLRCFDNDPELWRDGPPASLEYPYDLNGLATITTSSVSGANALAYYYFFYDWHVSTPMVECVSDRVEVTVTVVSIDEIEGLTSFNVYPNPTSDVLNLELELTGSKDFVMELIDLTGRIIEQTNFTAGVGQHREVLNVSDLESGVYELRLMTGSQQTSMKVIVQ
jgi:hypothetical protein